MKLLCSLSLLVVLLVSRTYSVAESGAMGATEILKWKDGKKAAFVLGFDDGAPSHLQHVLPELEKRKIVGTFYLVTGNKLYAAQRTKWEAAAKSPYVVVANHTFTHQGATSAEELGTELQKCNEVLYALHPERKQPRLLAFGRPGGVPWTVTDADVEAALAQHHLVQRPPFAGPPINYKTQEETLAVVDRALAKGELGYLIFHGVGTDWLVTPKDWFIALLDRLDAEREQLWLTDTASCAKYMKERDTAETRVLEATADRVCIALTSKTDPALYDEPLTLKTKVPADWKRCSVVQSAMKATLAAADGALLYSAVPGGGEIVIQPVK